MLGLMQDHPLLISSLIEFAERHHGDNPLVASYLGINVGGDPLVAKPLVTAFASQSLLREDERQPLPVGFSLREPLA